MFAMDSCMRFGALNDQRLTAWFDFVSFVRHAAGLILHLTYRIISCCFEM